jgi:hypothetical protein
MFNNGFKKKQKKDTKDKVDYATIAYAEAISVGEAEEKEKEAQKLLIEQNRIEEEKATEARKKEFEERERKDAERRREHEKLEKQEQEKRASAPYVVLKSYTTDRLADTVNNYILKGYDPVGGICTEVTRISSGSRDVDSMYLQTMYKKPSDKKD